MAPRKAPTDAATSKKESPDAQALSKQPNGSKVTKAKAPAAKSNKTQTATKALTPKATAAKSTAAKTTNKKVMTNGTTQQEPTKHDSTSSLTSRMAGTKIKDGDIKAPTTTGKATKSKATAEPAAKKPSVKAQETKKRKAQEEEAAVPVTRPVKKARKTAPHVAINQAPTQRLNVYVCGEGSSGELGLGTAKNAVDVKRPRLNALLAADTVGVVQVAVGGMHVAALTHDNKVLTWGVNDQGALGRDTTWEGGMKDVDMADDSDSESGSDSGMNPKECTPGEISSEYFPEDTRIVEVAASDSATFALTDDGFVYGWGTFRVSLHSL